MRLTQELGLHELYEEEQYEHNVQTQRRVSIVLDTLSNAEYNINVLSPLPVTGTGSQ